MAISETLIDVELINTFEDWRNETNKALKVLRESSDDDPIDAIVTTDFTGATYINVISSNSVSANTVTGVKLTFTGQSSIVDFTDANVVSLGIASQIKVRGGSTVSGSNPDSYIQSVQIRDSEILLNGQDLRADGQSQIDFTEAVITNLGEVQILNVYPYVPSGGTGTAGTIHGTSLKINSTYYGTITVQSGTHNFTGATVLGGKYDSSEFYSGLIHSSDFTANTGYYLITNTSAIFASNDDANVGIGKFPEWSGPGSLRYPVSSSGRLHIRRDFADVNSQKITVDANSDELVVEGNTSVGMTFLANTTSNSHIKFGDAVSPTKGFIKYSNDSNKLTLGVNQSETVKIYPDNGGSLEIATQGSFENIQGKLHIHQNNLDDTYALYINADKGNRSAVVVDGDQSTSDIIDIRTTTLTTGSLLNMRYGTSTINWTGSIVELNDDNQTNDSRKLFVLNQNHEDASGTRLMDLYTKSGRGLYINSDSNYYSIFVDSENTTANTIDIFSDNITSGSAIFVRSISDHTSNLVSIVSEGAGTLGSSLYVRTHADNLGDTLLVENNDGKVLNVESLGKVGVNLSLVDGETILIKRQTNEPTAVAPNEVIEVIGDGTAWHTLHVGGTLGVEANSIFNGNEMRINSNVVHQNGNTTIFLMDAHGTDGYAIFGIGENATDSTSGTTLYATYPGGTRQGYSYLGMGQIIWDAGPGNEAKNRRPEYWGIEFNQYNNSLLFPGKMTVANNVLIKHNVHIDKHVTANGDMTIDGDISLANGSVTFTDTGPNPADGQFTFGHPTTFETSLLVQGPLDARGGVTFDGDFVVSGNALFDYTGPFTVNPLAYFKSNVLMKDHLTVDKDLHVKTDSFFDGDVRFDSTNKTVTFDGKLYHTGQNVIVSSSTSNTHVKGTSNFNGNTRFFGANLYIDSVSSNTFSRGNLTVGGNVKFNGSNTDVTANVNISGLVYSQNAVSLVNIKDDVLESVALTVTGEYTDTGVKYGNTWIVGRLNNKGNTEIFGDLTISGNIKGSGDFDMQNTDLNVRNLRVEQDATVIGNINVSEGDIIGSDDLFINRNLIVRGENPNAVGHTYAGHEELEPRGYLWVDNPLVNNYIAGTLTIGRGDVDIINGTLRVSQGDIIGDDDLTVTGSISAGKQITTDLHFYSQKYIETIGTGTDNVNKLGSGTLTVVKANNEGNVYVTGNTTITKDLTIHDRLFVEKQTLLKDTLTVNKDATFKGNKLTANGNITFDGEITANSLVITTGNTTNSTGVKVVNGKLEVLSTTANNYIQNKLYVKNGLIVKDGNLHVKSSTTIDGTTYSEGAITTNGDLWTKKNLKSTGILTVDSRSESSIAGGTLKVSWPTNENGNVYISGNASVTQDLTVSGDIFVTGDIRAASVTYQSVSVAGNYSATGYVEGTYFNATGGTSTFQGVNATSIVASSYITSSSYITAQGAITGTSLSAGTTGSISGAGIRGTSLNLLGYDGSSYGNITNAGDITCQKITIRTNGVINETGNVKTPGLWVTSNKSKFDGMSEFTKNVKISARLSAKASTGDQVDCAIPIYNSAGTILNLFNPTIS